MKWHEDDPVDPIEQRRNDQVAIYQGNRNPFIDYPALVNRIWGDASQSITNTPSSGGSSSGSGSGSTSTGSGLNGFITNSLTTKDEVVFMCANTRMELSSINTTNKYGEPTAYSGNPVGNWIMRVEKGSIDNTWSFVKDGGYLAWSSGNSLTTSTTKDEKSSWYVTFDDSRSATILNAADKTRQIWYSQTYTRFSTYVDKTAFVSNYYPIKIFEKEHTEVSYIFMNKDEASLKIGGTLQLSTTGYPNYVPYSVTWSSGNSTVASVDSSGLVTAKGVGTAYIYAKVSSNTSISTYCKITVESYTSSSTQTSVTLGSNYIIDSEATSASKVTTGMYILKVSIDSELMIFDPATVISSSTYAAVSESSITSSKLLKNYFFTVTVDKETASIKSSGEGSGTHTAYYLNENTGTSFQVNETEFTKYSYSDSNGSILFSSGDRGLLLYKTNSSTKFGFYKTSNVGKANYFVPQLYKVDTAYNLLFNKLESMNCDDIKKSTFRSNLVELYNQLSEIEKNKLTSVSIKCNDGDSYYAYEAYFYAINYLNKSSNSKIFTSYFSLEKNHSTIILAIVASISIVGTFLILFKRKKEN